MNEFDYEVKQRKNIARSARNRKGTVFGPRGCRLPSDNLTAAQKRKLNGAVVTYDLSAPLTRGETMNLPPDIRKEYFTRILEHGGNAVILGRVWGCSTGTVLNTAATCGFKFPRTRGGRDKTAAWTQWLRRYGLDVNGKPIETTEEITGETDEFDDEQETALAATPSEEESTTGPGRPETVMTTERYSITLSGPLRIVNIADALFEMSGRLPLGGQVSVTITVEKKGSEDRPCCSRSCGERPRSPAPPSHPACMTGEPCNVGKEPACRSG